MPETCRASCLLSRPMQHSFLRSRSGCVRMPLFGASYEQIRIGFGGIWLRRWYEGGNTLDLSKLAGLRIPEPLQIAQLLSKRSQIFSDKTEAVDFAAAQPRLWRPVLKLLSEQSGTRQIFENLEQNVAQADFLVLDPSEGGNDFKVTGSIPLLSENALPVLEVFAKRHFGLIAAAVIVECRSISAPIKAVTLPLDILSEMLIYASGGMTTTDVAGRLWD